MPIDTSSPPDQATPSATQAHRVDANAAYLETLARHKMAEVDLVAASTGLNAAYDAQGRHFQQITQHTERIGALQQSIEQTIYAITREKRDVLKLAEVMAQDPRLLGYADDVKAAQSQVRVHLTRYFDIETKIDQLQAQSTAAYSAVKISADALESLAAARDGQQPDTGAGILEPAKEKHGRALLHYHQALADQELAGAHCEVARIDAASARQFVAEAADGVNRVSPALIVQAAVARLKLTQAKQSCLTREKHLLETQEHLDQAGIELATATAQYQEARLELDAAIMQCMEKDDGLAFSGVAEDMGAGQLHDGVDTAAEHLPVLVGQYHAAETDQTMMDASLL